MTDRPAGDEIVPFLRTGPPPDRTRWEGWQQWRRIRGTFIPAPRLSLQEYRTSALGAAACTTCTGPPRM